MNPEFVCHTCGATFQIPAATLARFPGWQPKECLLCRRAREKASDSRKLSRARVTRLPPARVAGAREEAPATADGCYTDGSARPNPGPGGWAVVRVEGGRVVEERSGGAAHTTNNRMELTALIQAYRMLPPGQSAVVWTDSELCVKSMTAWAPGWERNGWKRKAGPIQNLDLVQELYALVRARPELRLRWLRGHAGAEWNERADRLATEAAMAAAAGR